MERRFAKGFADADEVTDADLLRSEVVHLGGVSVSRDVLQPGWRWSTHVRPLVGGDWCRVRHVGVVLSGRFRFLLDDGQEFEVGPGEVMTVPAGHDSWVVGDEPVQVLGWTGVRGWLGPLDIAAERVVTTLVMTDIVGSTTLARRLGDRAWGELLAQFADDAQTSITRYRGQLVELTGDGVLARFDGALRAVNCAIALRAEAAALDLPIRAVVHTGEVELAESRLRGVALHEAARMLGLAGDGEILVSAVARTLAPASGLTYTDRGEHELRGLEGTYRVFSVNVG